MLDSFQITITGGFAVCYALLMLLVVWYVGCIIINCIFGGKTVITYESEGLIPRIKRWRRKGHNKRNDKHFP